jgi:hypothetical protein
VTHIATWEAFSPLRENTRYNSNDPPFDLDASGNIIFGWKKNTDPLSYEMLADLVQRGYVTRDQLPFRLKDATTGTPVRLHRSSVQWNDFRRSWIMIGVESFGTSFLGEVWFAEAPTPEGPWEKAVKVVTHNRGTTSDYSFYNPALHPYFDEAGVISKVPTRIRFRATRIKRLFTTTIRSCTGSTSGQFPISSRGWPATTTATT